MITELIWLAGIHFTFNFASGGARECISQIQIIIIQSFRNWFPYFSSFLSPEVDTFEDLDVETFVNPDVDTFGMRGYQLYIQS